MKPSDHNISDAMAKYLARLEETRQVLCKQIAPVFRMQERTQDLLRPVIKAQEKLQKSIGPIWHAQQCMNKFVESLRLPYNLAINLSRSVQPALEFTYQLQHVVSSALARSEKSFRNLPERTRNVLLTLGNHGWFIDIDMPLSGLWEIEKAIEEGDIDEVKEALIDYFRKRLAEIEKSIAKRFPHREKILSAAFKAHGRAEYELSVPVFLAQADGICKEVISQQLFMTQNKKPRTAAYVETIGYGTFRAALLNPLAVTLPIGASEKERGENFAELNRHQVLHGESIDYGTEVNSLKSISLLNYVVHVLKEDKKGDKEP